MQLQGKETPQRHKLHTAGAGVAQKSEKKKRKSIERKKKATTPCFFLKTKSGCPKNLILIYIFLSVSPTPLTFSIET